MDFGATVSVRVLRAEPARTRLLSLQVSEPTCPETFLRTHQAQIDEALHAYGGILMRGFGGRAIAPLEAYSRAVLHAPMPYCDRATPRSHVSGAVFTSTDAPEDLHIRMHCESSFTAQWPARILFQCLTPATEGGATPVCDVRRVYERVPREIRDKLERLGISYVRHFGAGPGMDFREVFQVEDEQGLRRFCADADIHVGETPEGLLRLWQTRPASARHPKTGEHVWFNHACTLHVSLLEGGLRDTLRAQFGAGRLPHNTYAGDGSELSDELVAHLYAAYEAETLRFTWQPGDVLLLDNMLMAHGREPYSGGREVVVTMGDPLRWADVEHGATATFSPCFLDADAPVREKRRTGGAALSEGRLLDTLLDVTRAALDVADFMETDSFFEAGGDSVTAATIVQALEEAADIVMPLELIFELDTVAEWSRVLDTQQS